jgi:small subunit ribosomal protein S1
MFSNLAERWAMYKGASRFLQHQAMKAEDKPSKDVTKSRVPQTIPRFMRDALDSSAWLQGKVKARVKGGFVVTIRGFSTFCPNSEMYPPKLATDELSKLRKREIRFQIINIDSKNNTIIVSRKRVIQKLAWNGANNAFDNGITLPGIVKDVREYGIIVDLDGIDGLVPLSELDDQPIADLPKTLGKGQEVDCTVIGIDEEKQQITLSLHCFRNEPVKH